MIMESRQHVFIINPNARKQDQEELLRQIEVLAKQADCRIEMTNRRGHAKELAKQYAQSGQPTRIYACGGDGTLHEVVNGILGFANVELAVVPIGTGNDFVKAFDWMKREDFLQLAHYAEAQTRWCDVLMVNDQASINTVSAGLDVKVAYHVDKFKKLPKAHGVIPYYLGLLVSMMGRISETFRVEIDGQPIQRQSYLFVVAGNGKYYGGGFCPTPFAIINDGQMDICLIKKVSRARILRLSGKYKRGTHVDYTDLATITRAKGLRIDTEGKRISLSLDGELYETADPRITIQTRAIRLALPVRGG